MTGRNTGFTRKATLACRQVSARLITAVLTGLVISFDVLTYCVAPFLAGFFPCFVLSPRWLHDPLLTRRVNGGRFLNTEPLLAFTKHSNTKRLLVALSLPLAETFET